MQEHKSPAEGAISTIYIASTSGAPMQSIPSATLIKGVGIEGDRYHARRGTYSGTFMAEPGRNLTMVSEDAIQETMKLQNKDHYFTMDKLRRNLVVKGLSAQDMNDMVGREVRIIGSSSSSCRLFVHRRNVPCKYREAQTECPNFMNIFWQDCGVCCEILEGGTIHVGDTIVVVAANAPQPQRCNIGLKPHAFFVKPADRSLEDVKKQIVPVHIAVAISLWDPKGFQQVEAGYRNAGQHFWSPQAYRAGMFVITHVRTPLLLVAVAVVASSIAIKAAT